VKCVCFSRDNNCQKRLGNGAGNSYTPTKSAIIARSMGQQVQPLFNFSFLCFVFLFLFSFKNIL
jgi:hypothetical protein